MSRNEYKEIEETREDDLDVEIETLKPKKNYLQIFCIVIVAVSVFIFAFMGIFFGVFNQNSLMQRKVCVELDTVIPHIWKLSKKSKDSYIAIYKEGQCAKEQCNGDPESKTVFNLDNDVANVTAPSKEGIYRSFLFSSQHKVLAFSNSYVARNKCSLEQPQPLVIAHRGASGYLPEHTRESYSFAVKLGADYIETDLVSTKDGYLVARHEPNILHTTTVKDMPEFADRRRIEKIDGKDEDGYWVRDFTLEEIKKLRALQTISDRDQSFNGMFEILTIEEILDLAASLSKEYKREIGVYIETKHPIYHDQNGLPLGKKLVDTLQKHNLNNKNSKVYIQSFESHLLKSIRNSTEVKLIQLIANSGLNTDGSLKYGRPYDWVFYGRNQTWKDMVSLTGLEEVKTYADGIGPDKHYIISAKCIQVNNTVCVDVNGDGLVDESDRELIAPSSIISDAHSLGLHVHPYTFRNEKRYLASDYKGSGVNEVLKFLDLGVDGLFADFSDAAVSGISMYNYRLKF